MPVTYLLTPSFKQAATQNVKIQYSARHSAKRLISGRRNPSFNHGNAFLVRRDHLDYHDDSADDHGCDRYQENSQPGEQTEERLHNASPAVKRP